MRLFIIILSYVFLMGVGMDTFSAKIFPESEKDKISDVVLFDVAKNLKSKFNLYPIGSGGKMLDEIKLLSLSFEYIDTLNIEEIRNLFISCAEIFIKTINENKKIRQFLFEYPVTIKNVELTIFFVTKEGNSVLPPSIAVVSNKDNKISYSRIKNAR